MLRTCDKSRTRNTCRHWFIRVHDPRNSIAKVPCSTSIGSEPTLNMLVWTRCPSRALRLLLSCCTVHTSRHVSNVASRHRSYAYSSRVTPQGESLDNRTHHRTYGIIQEQIVPTMFMLLWRIFLLWTSALQQLYRQLERANDIECGCSP